MEDGEAGQRRREHRHGARLADGHGRADVLADERLLDGHRVGREARDDVAKGREDAHQPRARSGSDAFGAMTSHATARGSPPSSEMTPQPVDARAGVDAEDDRRGQRLVAARQAARVQLAAYDAKTSSLMSALK